MIYTHNIDPVLLSFESISIHWYGIMYVISFLIIDYLIKQDIKAGNVSFTVEVCENLLVFCLITLLIGGRLGYVLFYDIKIMELYVKENKNPEKPPSEPNIKASEGGDKKSTGPSRYFSDN